MSTKPKPANCHRKISPPLKGWRWLINEKTKRGDWFISQFNHICGVVKGVNIGLHSDGPTITDNGAGKYTVSGYIRRVKK